MRTVRNSILFLLALCGAGVQAQSVLRLDLKETITMANDSSLSAFRYQNMYLSGYWEYRSYKAARLPSLTLNMTPAQYYRNITRRYDSQEDIDVYREQQMFSAGAGLNLAQNFDLLGGTFYVDTQLDYMRNFGDSKSNQILHHSFPYRISTRVAWLQRLQVGQEDRAAEVREGEEAVSV